MDKIVQTFCNLLKREDKLFNYKFISFEETKIPDNIKLGLIFLYCEYIELGKTLDQLCVNAQFSELNHVIAHDFYQVFTARIIELMSLVHQIEEPLWMTILTKKKWTTDNINFTWPTHLSDKKRMEELVRRNEIIRLVIESEQKIKNDLIVTDSDPDTEIEHDLSLEGAVILIQSVERRRVALLLGKSLRKLRSNDWVNRLKFKSKYNENEAAKILQNAFRVYTYRKRYKRIRQAELNLLGLGTIEDSTEHNLNSYVHKFDHKEKHQLYVLNQTDRSHKHHKKKNQSNVQGDKMDVVKETLGSKIYKDLKSLYDRYKSNFRYGEKGKNIISYFIQDYNLTKHYEAVCTATMRPQINSIVKHSNLFVIFKEFIIANLVWPIKENIRLDDIISQQVEVTIKHKRFMADLATVIGAFCLSPLFSTYISQTTGKIRNLLLIGPHGSGKGTFVEAMAASTGSVLFRFTRQNLRGGKATKILKQNLKTFVKKDIPCIFWFEKVGKSLKPGLKTLIKAWIQKWTKYAKGSEGLLVVVTSDQKNVATGFFHMKIEFPQASEEARFEIIKRFMIERRKSWNLPEDALQLSFISEVTSATKHFQVGSIVNVLRSAANESLRQKLKSLKKPFALEDFLPKIQSLHINKKL